MANQNLNGRHNYDPPQSPFNLNSIYQEDDDNEDDNNFQPVNLTIIVSHLHIQALMMMSILILTHSPFTIKFTEKQTLTTIYMVVQHHIFFHITIHKLIAKFSKGEIHQQLKYNANLAI